MPANSRALLSSRARRSKNKCMCECLRAPSGRAAQGLGHGGIKISVCANAREPQAAEPRRGLGAAEYVVSDANALESGAAVLDLK